METKIKRYFNEKQVSEITGLSLPTLRNYRHLRKGPPYHKVGRAVRYADTDLSRFMESKKIQTDET
jgi:predicted DNA-binding transcriptional regulator AlpA